MTRHFIVLILMLVACLSGLSQNADSLQTGVHADPRLKVLVSKHNEVLTKGHAKGYRVQIYFGTDKTKAKEIKAKFIAAYGSEAHAYEIYEVPNFKIRVGDFRTRMEAYRFLRKIRADYPESFIVACEIEMPKVK